MQTLGFNLCEHVKIILMVINPRLWWRQRIRSSRFCGNLLRPRPWLASCSTKPRVQWYQLSLKMQLVTGAGMLDAGAQFFGLRSMPVDESCLNFLAVDELRNSLPTQSPKTSIGNSRATLVKNSGPADMKWKLCTQCTMRCSYMKGWTCSPTWDWWACLQ